MERERKSMRFAFSHLEREPTTAMCGDLMAIEVVVSNVRSSSVNLNGYVSVEYLVSVGPVVYQYKQQGELEPNVPRGAIIEKETWETAY